MPQAVQLIPIGCIGLANICSAARQGEDRRPIACEAPGAPGKLLWSLAGSCRPCTPAITEQPGGFQVLGVAAPPYSPQFASWLLRFAFSCPIAADDGLTVGRSVALHN